VALRRKAWAQHGHGMTSVNQTQLHCVNQMGKTYSKPLAAWCGRGMAWARHAMCETAPTLTIIRSKGPTDMPQELDVALQKEPHYITNNPLQHPLQMIQWL